MSYCHQPMSVMHHPLSVMRHQHFALNSIFFETPWSWTFTSGMKHCLVDFYQVCSDDAPGVQNGPAAGVLGSKITKSSSQELLGSGA